MKGHVVLVHPRTKGKDSVTYPLAFLALGAALEAAGYRPVVINMEHDRDWRERIAESIDKALFVGITAMSDWQIRFGLEVSEFVRSCRSEATIVWGGWHATTLDELTAVDPRVDIVVRGEGEQAIVELAEALATDGDLTKVPSITYEHGGDVIRNPNGPVVHDMDSLPVPAWHLIDMHAYLERFGEKTLCVYGGRGCAMKCTFCSHKIMPYAAPRSISAGRLLDGIEGIVRKHGIKHVRFYEPTFISSKRRAAEISEEMERRKLGFTWEGSCRANVIKSFEPELCSRLRNAGCVQLNFGFESGSQRLLDRLQKKTQCEHHWTTAEKCRDHGIRLECYFIGGFPFEAPSDLAATVDMMIGLQSLLPTARVLMLPYIPFPGTPVYYECVEEHGLRFLSSLEEWGEMIDWSEDRPWLPESTKMLIHTLCRFFNPGPAPEEIAELCRLPTIEERIKRIVLTTNGQISRSVERAGAVS